MELNRVILTSGKVNLFSLKPLISNKIIDLLSFGKEGMFVLCDFMKIEVI